MADGEKKAVEKREIGMPMTEAEFLATFKLLHEGTEGLESCTCPAWVGGFYMFSHFPALWPYIYQMPVEKDDVIVASFPKCGTTWMQHLVYLVKTRDFEGASKWRVDERIPFLEFPTPATPQTLINLANRPSPRIFKTHAPAKWLPRDAHKGKVVYMYRNAKDACVSLFNHHFRLSNGEWPFPFEKMARDFIEGKGEPSSKVSIVVFVL